MGARFNWIMHFGLPPRYNKDVRVIQLDIEPEAMHQNKPAEVALVGDGKAIVGQLNRDVPRIDVSGNGLGQIEAGLQQGLIARAGALNSRR